MKPEKFFIDKDNIDINIVKKLASFIKEGKIVALPTETVYGLAANMSRRDVLDRLYEIKKRPQDRLFTLHISSPDFLDFFADILPPYGYRLVEKFWPGPLTIIAYAKNSQDSIGVRCPDHLITSLIIKESLCKVAMPSANISGNPPAVSSQEVEEIFNGSIDAILDTNLPPKYKVSSTIIDLISNPPKILREGPILSQDLDKILSSKRLLFVCTGNTCRSVMAEYLLRLYLKERRRDLIDRIEVISCGIQAFEGMEVSSHTYQLLLKEGIDSSSHKAKRINKALLRSSDIIITMEEKHREIIGSIEPTAFPRTFLMGKFLKDRYGEDIPDPIGGSEEDFKKVFLLIKEAIENILQWL